MNQILLDKSILHSFMVKHNRGINKITYFLAIQLIWFQNAIYSIVILSRIYILGLKIKKYVFE